MKRDPYYLAYGSVGFSDVLQVVHKFRAVFVKFQQGKGVGLSPSLPFLSRPFSPSLPFPSLPIEVGPLKSI